MSKNRDNSPLVLCAIGHGLYEPWLSILQEGQLKTWLAESFPDKFEVIHYHGTPGSRLTQKLDRIHEKIRWKNRYVARLLVLFDNLLLLPFIDYIPAFEVSKLLTNAGKAIHIKFPDTYLTYRWKFLSLLKYFVEQTDADFLFITSSSSYVQPELVLDYVHSIPDATTYAGAEPYSGAGFISGSNRIISRSIASQVLKTRRHWKPGVIEDVEFSRLVVANGNRIATFPIFNLDSLAKLYETSDSSIKNTYHFRLKSYDGALRNDVKIMKALHDRVQRVKGGDLIE